MKDISKDFIRARKEDSCLRLHIANGLYVVVITAFVIFGQAATWTNLTFELSIVFLCVGYCVLLLYHLHIGCHPYENERAVQKAINLLLFFIGLKMTGAIFSMPGMHPVNSLFIVTIVGAFLYGLRCEIGYLSFIFLALMCDIPWQEWAKKVICNELFWIGMMIFILIFTRNAFNEKVLFFIETLLIGFTTWWMQYISPKNNLLLLIAKMGLYSGILVLFLLTFPGLLEWALSWGISLILALCLEGILFLYIFLMPSIETYKIDGL